jgi:hypothetical protein
MFDWQETRNGSYVCEDDDSINITVFTDKNGDWRGIRDERITEDRYATAEDAMNAIEKGEAEFVKFRTGPKTTDWKPAKKGGYYRYHEGQILTAKQASSGRWYLARNGSVIRDQWFPSFEVAARYADSLI